MEYPEATVIKCLDSFAGNEQQKKKRSADNDFKPDTSEYHRWVKGNYQN